MSSLKPILAMSRFELRHGDADISSMLENAVPPPDLHKISIFSVHLERWGQQALDLETYLI